MSSANAWKVAASPAESLNFAEIMSEEYAHRVQDEEIKRFEKRKQKAQSEQEAGLQVDFGVEQSFVDAVKQKVDGARGQEDARVAAANGEAPALPLEALELLQQEVDGGCCESDEMLAQLLQSQFDHEYNEELRRIEQQRNKQSKVTVTLDKFRRNGDLEFLHEDDAAAAYAQEEDEEERHKRDWDRFETNEKILETIPKCGFKLDQAGQMITKHDEQLCGVRNACRVMSFPPEFATGDGAGFDMKLSNQVFNQLRTHSRRSASNSGSCKKNKMHDRKENAATAEMGMDGKTSMILYKLINNQILEQINGIISTGKEAVILHASSDPAYAGGAAHSQQRSGALLPPELLPAECAVKVFKTTLNEFKQRDRYIKDDYRFKDRFSKQNNTVIINMWAEKEMHNLMRMRSVGLNCPDVVMLKKHVLVMSFVGGNHRAAPKLKDASLGAVELARAYEEVVAAMCTLYRDAKLVHADLSEYNILWHEGKCWFIDVAQSVEPEHPSALEFLMRDCANIVNFFRKRGVPDVPSKERLFEHITALNAEVHNVAMLERIHTRGASISQATAPDQEDCPDELRPLEYPFDVAWEKALAEREQKKNKTAEADSAAHAMQALTVKCSVQAAGRMEDDSSTASIVAGDTANTTATN